MSFLTFAEPLIIFFYKLSVIFKKVALRLNAITYTERRHLLDGRYRFFAQTKITSTSIWKKIVSHSITDHSTSRLT